MHISCPPPGLLQGGVADILTRFLAKHPNVRIALEATNRRVDVIEEGLDIAVRVRQLPLEDSGLAMRKFVPDEMILVASPGLTAAYGEPQALEDVSRMPTISMTSVDGRSTWHFVGWTASPRNCLTRRV